jgi:mercuric ion transport protein
MNAEPASPPSRKWSVGPLAGAVIAAVLASACCLGPVLLAALGLGGAGLFVRFERYRPAFAVVTIGLLAAGFYFAYRQPRASSADCACPPRERRRLPKVLLWIGSAFVVALLFGGPLLARVAGSGHHTAQTGDRLVMLHVDGMSCAACSVSIRKSLSKLDGTHEVRVDVDAKRVSVSFDPQHVTPPAIVAAIEGVGYHATVEGTR